MLLQPIVENAVNHGIFNKEGPGLVQVNFKLNSPSELQVDILDDGIGFDLKKQTLKKKKSSSVIADRIYFLNQTGYWKINQEIHSLNKDAKYPGTQVVLTIKNLK